MAYSWLSQFQESMAFLYGGIGLLASIAVSWFGFSRIARKNILRVQAFGAKTCIFSFQSWRSYLNVALMMTIGITLRHSAVPREYLSVLYTTIGGGLFLSSFEYYKLLWQMLI
jgi:hypothetical protein